MSETEKTLIGLIRAADDPGKALVTAVQILVEFLNEQKAVEYGR